MATKEAPKFLKRYTSINWLLRILKEERLFMIGQEVLEKIWEDKNDVAGLQAFCRLKGTTAAVLCLAKGKEEIHHWNTYAKQGCCIEFYEDKIQKEFNAPDLLCGPVKYAPNEDITSAYLNKLGTDKIPFFKRRPNDCDNEYRVIRFGTNKVSNEIPFKISAIYRIVLSPYIPDIEREWLQSMIKKEFKVEVHLSRLLKSKEWISKFDNIGKKK